MKTQAELIRIWVAERITKFQAQKSSVESENRLSMCGRHGEMKVYVDQISVNWGFL